LNKNVFISLLKAYVTEQTVGTQMFTDEQCT